MSKNTESNLTPEAIKKWFELAPNTAEGGFNALVYTSSIDIPGAELPPVFAKIKVERPICGAIYYFLDQETFSGMHRVTGDMIYHFYSGDPVEMLLLYPKGNPNKYEVCIFSNDIANGGQPMKVIPGGTWLGSRLTPGGSYALMGVTMSPGFNPADYKIGNRNELIKEYPEQKNLITSLTRQSKKK